MNNNLWNVIKIELRKALHSRIPLFTGVGFMLLPLVGAFFMIILKDPEMARKAGLISAKAQLTAGTADWPSFIGLIAQGTAVGGTFVFSIITSWVIGREFSDGTFKDLLALPVSRITILLAKVIVIAIWSILIIVLVDLLSLAAGFLVGLPPVSPDLIVNGGLIVLATAGMVIWLLPVTVFFAGVGRGYLLPLGITIIFVLFANVAAIAGWGQYFPWSVPALFSGAGGAQALEPVSYVIVFLTGLAGMAAAGHWWQYADQHK